jgi:hypothetical protein
MHHVPSNYIHQSQLPSFPGQFQPQWNMPPQPAPAPQLQPIMSPSTFFMGVGSVLALAVQFNPKASKALIIGSTIFLNSVAAPYFTAKLLK